VRSSEALVGALRAAGCVFAEEEAEVLAASAASPEELEALLARRVAGVPLEHVVGWAEFRGLRIVVDEGVFVPRRRTELLVEQGVALAPRRSRPSAEPESVIVDLCCGSAAVATALAVELPGAEVHAADVDPAAVRCARRNLEPRGGYVHEGDLDAALPADLRGRVDLLLANAPYVPSAEVPLMPPEARDHEPLTALDGGVDGLDLHRRIAALAPRWLRPGGLLLIETSRRQAPGTAAAMVVHGMGTAMTRSEELDATVVIGISAGASRRRRSST
jgi:release factor glutamine methyltransferase